MNTVRWTGVVVSLAFVACAPSGQDVSTTKILSEWQGDQIHVIGEGFLNGESLKFDIVGEEARAAANIRCERQYATVGAPPQKPDGSPDYSGGYFRGTKIRGFWTDRRVELEFLRQVMPKNPPGTILKMIPRVETQLPGPDETWFEWEWHHFDTNAKLLEKTAQEGTFTVQRMTGEPDSSGLLVPEGEGIFAGFIDAKWSETEFVKLSFTLPCLKNTFQIVAPGEF